MFNNVVLDVFIGLVLLYLLYSLLMTIVSEMLATWMNLRPRILRVSIEKMLNDGFLPEKKRPVVYPWVIPWSLFWSYILDCWVIIQGFFLREFKDFKYTFAARFFEIPSIKYLVGNAGGQRTFFTQTKPSYISADNFAESLLQLLKDNGSGSGEMDKVHFTLRYNTHHIQAGSLKQLRDLAENSGADVKVFKEKLKAWFNETQDRATGWYKKKLQVILFWLGFLVAAIFNVDSIRIAKMLAKDKKAREQLVAIGIEMAGKDSARYRGYINNNGDSVKGNQIIDSSFSYITEDIREASLVLGLGWGTDKLRKPLIYTIDTMNNAVFRPIEKKISNKKYDTLKLVSGALKDSLEKDIDSLDRAQEIIASLKLQSFLVNTILQIDSINREIDTAHVMVKRLEARKTRDSLSLQLTLKDIGLIHQMANVASGSSFQSIDSIQLNAKNGTINIAGQRGYYASEKVGYVIKKVLGLHGMWGFIITGLMISLGAPFWFDLLKKLVMLRGAGVKPEEKEAKNPAARADDSAAEEYVKEKPETPALSATIEEKAKMALDQLTKRSLDDPGIIAIAIEYQTTTNQPFLNMMVEDAQAKDFLQNKYGGSEKLANGFTIPINYSIGDEIALHIAREGSEINNESKILGSGTLGCHLRKRGSGDIYFISCWHVMKDNHHWNDAPEKKIILCQGKALGRIEGGFLSHDPETGMDIGIAKYHDIADVSFNPNFLIKKQHRAVTAFDVAVSTPVDLCGKVSGVKSAIIFHNTINARIKYPDGKTYLMNDVFTISRDGNRNESKVPTTQGDSGAVVIDKSGTPLGMVIGGGGNFSFAVKFTNLFGEGKPLKDYFFNIKSEV